MSVDSAIEWTDATWNPTTGCDRVSPGCDHCYALTLAKRLKAMGNRRYQNDGSPKTSGPGFGLTLHPDKISEPFSWRKPRRVFVNSMSDLFHEDVPDEFIRQVFEVMGKTRQHTYQILTKRPRRMARLLNDGIIGEYLGELGPLPNVWLGTSVEDQKRADLRIPLLLETPAAIRFLSCEPLLGPIDLTTTPGGQALGECDECGWSEDPACDMCMGLGGIHWVIVGGESGAHARPMDPEWVRTLRDQCEIADVAFFFKQWGGRTPKAGGRHLDGRTWDEMPTSFRKVVPAPQSASA